MKNCIPLDYQVQSRELVGGKAQSLQKLMQLGYRVPDGFIILATVNSLDNSEVVQEITANLEKLDSTFVAVRSSATAEDGAEASWAGQFRSFLGVPHTKVIEKIRACRNSSKTHRVQSYQQHQTQKGSISMAVMVQEMVASHVSGVAFSKDPVSGDDTVVIEAIYGLGDGLVSGAVTPDFYVLDRTGKVLRSEVAVQPDQQVLTGQGVQQKTVHPDQQRSQKISDAQLQELREEIISLEQQLGYPVDVEWSFCNDQLYILQTRPITRYA